MHRQSQGQGKKQTPDQRNTNPKSRSTLDEMHRTDFTKSASTTTPADLGLQVDLVEAKCSPANFPVDPVRRPYSCQTDFPVDPVTIPYTSFWMFTRFAHPRTPRGWRSVSPLPCKRKSTRMDHNEAYWILDSARPLYTLVQLLDELGLLGAAQRLSSAVSSLFVFSAEAL